uniref:Tc1-like transposase DDE domain-containing protein n=1 Tax=Oncorhynchus tshawytscha TaxID=74940 RepID=A0AAZ3P9R7_ONCTS
MHLIYESCQSQYKVKRRKGLEGGEMTRNDSVDRFMCELIGGVEDLVHFSLFSQPDGLIGRRPQNWTTTQHTSRLCKGYLTKKKNDRVLHEMTWPPQSPNLNQIEMVWDELGSRVKEKQPTSAQHMWELLQDCWESIPVEAG